MTEMAMACLAAFVIGGFMRMKSFKTALAQFAGALVCAITMHNAVTQPKFLKLPRRMMS